MRINKNQSQSNLKNQTNHPPTLTWHSGDYEEFFIFITPSRFGAAYTIKEMGEVIHRNVVLSATDTQTAFDLAVKSARRWVRANHPAAKIRLRSMLEHSVLFPALHNQQRRAA